MPQASYVASVDSPLSPDPQLLRRLASEQHNRRAISDLVVPVRSGHAFPVQAGQIVRFSTVDGPQVVDLNLWSQSDPRERFWASRTRQFYGTHVTTGHRLWSNLPFLRPMVTFIADTIGYGRDEDDAGCHDLLGTRCDPYVNQMLSGAAYDFHCHSNLTRAIAEFGLTEFDVHDVINLFQVTGLMPDDKRYFMKACPARPGDHVELLAEIDLLMAISLCPGGDLAAPLWGEGSDVAPNCNPLRVQVFEPDPALLDGWKPAERAAYSGMSGLRHGYGSPADPPPPLTERVPVEN
ncbi:MAG: urea carboxylase-associated family protein [Ilumatobacteraceae bacterium]